MSFLLAFPLPKEIIFLLIELSSVLNRMLRFLFLSLYFFMILQGGCATVDVFAWQLGLGVKISCAMSVTCGLCSYNVMVMACKTGECGAKCGCSAGTCTNESLSCGWFSEAAAYVAYYG